MTNDYRPIACGLYDRFELLASHAELIELETVEVQGSPRRLSGRARDLCIHDGAEYLVIEDEAGRRSMNCVSIASPGCAARATAGNGVKIPAISDYQYNPLFI